MNEPRTKVLLTGATGYVGQHLLKRLVEQGVSVRWLARRSIRGQINTIFLETARYRKAPELFITGVIVVKSGLVALEGECLPIKVTNFGVLRKPRR